MPERQPPPRSQTIRDAIRAELLAGWVSARQLSANVGISEKDVPGHLDHLQRSAAGAGERFEVEPAACIECGYAFEDRDRLSKPSRCPACKSQRIGPPRFRIAKEAP